MYFTFLFAACHTDRPYIQSIVSGYFPWRTGESWWLISMLRLWYLLWAVLTVFPSLISTDYSYWSWWWNAPVLERVPLSKVPGTEPKYDFHSAYNPICHSSLAQLGFMHLLQSSDSLSCVGATSYARSYIRWHQNAASPGNEIIEAKCWWSASFHL
jgi:hypothetical protein